MDTGIFGRVFDFARAEAFALALPASLRQWAPYFIAAGRQHGVDPWILAGICYRETLGGTAGACQPKGAACTGDFTPRGPNSRYFRYADPATGLPNDHQGGWGRGLMQLDFGAQHDWVVSHDWRDPAINIGRAAEVFAANLRFFEGPPRGNGVPVECWRITKGMNGVAPWQSKYPGAYPPCVRTDSNGISWTAPLKDPRPLNIVTQYEAATAAYNAGPEGVLQALAMGLPAEAVTTGQEYVSYFASRIAAWSRTF